jgi:hypothetical protein
MLHSHFSHKVLFPGYGTQIVMVLDVLYSHLKEHVVADIQDSSFTITLYDVYGFFSWGSI